MAMTSYNKFILTVVAVALFLCNCEADLINDVCSKTTKPVPCNQALRSDPRSKGADLRGLAGIIIEKSQAAIQVATKVAKSVQTSRNKKIIKTCIETQKDAKDTLNDCKKLLKQAKIDRASLNTYASAALDDVGTCDDEFESSESAKLSEPAKLQKASQDAQDLISVLLAISNLM